MTTTSVAADSGGESSAAPPSPPQSTPSPLLVAAAVAICPVLYVVFVAHYATNALQFDEWSLSGFLGHPSWGELWGQYGEPRIPVVRAVFLLFARTDHLNTEAVILFNAVLWIVAYALVLILFRRYLGHPIGLVSPVVIGVIWFSLADAQNALWAFQTGWFVVGLAFVVMTAALLLSRHHRALWLTVAILAAVVASLAWIQGFLLWPLGALCLLWSDPKARRALVEAGMWCAAFVVTATLYLVGYDRHDTTCVAAVACHPTSALAHPLAALRYFVVIVGNVIPGSYSTSRPAAFLDLSTRHLLRFEVIGVLMLLGALWVIVGSIRSRRMIDRLPVPLFFVAFGLLFEASITWGRLGEGPSVAIAANRYVMPGVIILVGIVIYAWRHLQPNLTGWLIGAGLACVIGAQVIIGTAVGLSSGTNTSTFLTQSAQLAVNVDRVPTSARSCELVAYWIPPNDVAPARADRLAEFSSGEAARYRALGLPLGAASCHHIQP